MCLSAELRLLQVGRFFGEVDGSVMASLIKMGMFKKYDGQEVPLLLLLLPLVAAPIHLSLERFSALSMLFGPFYKDNFIYYFYYLRNESVC